MVVVLRRSALDGGMLRLMKVMLFLRCKEWLWLNLMRIDPLLLLLVVGETGCVAVIAGAGII